MRRSSTARHIFWRIIWLVTFGLTALCAVASLAFAQEFAVSAKVDKTTANVGEPITLTLTLSGDIAQLDLSKLSFPEEFAVIGRSQSTNFIFRGGATERSMSLNIVLVAQRDGTFQLGPFSISQGKQEFHTEPISVTIKKSVLPPSSPPPQGGRFTI